MIWSPVTCHRLDLRRLGANAVARLDQEFITGGRLRQVAEDESADRSAHSKKEAVSYRRPHNSALRRFRVLLDAGVLLWFSTKPFGRSCQAFGSRFETRVARA